MIRRTCTFAAVVLIALLVSSAAASAQYGAGDIGVQPGAEAGAAPTVSGHICSGEAGHQVDIFVDGQLFTSVISGAGGAFSAVLTGLSAGDHDVKSVSDGGTCVLATEVTVTAGGGGATTTLPRTGSNDTIPLSRIGLAAIAAGGALVLVSRKRLGKKVDVTV